MRARRGFTLLEVAVALLIVTTALLYLQNAITGSIDRIANTIKQRAARTLARRTLETYLASGGQGATEGGFEEQEYQEFRYRIVQEQLTVGTSQSILRIQVVVEFPLDDIESQSRQSVSQGGSGSLAGFGDGNVGQVTLTTFVPAPEVQ